LTETLRIKNLIKKIQEKSTTLSGGSGEKVRYVMYEPDLYWKLGEVIEELMNNLEVPENERFSWIDENLRSLEEQIWPGHHPSKMSYKFKYHFIDKERFNTVKKISGDKFKQFRAKRASDYLCLNFSKRKPTATPEQQEQLIKELAKKNFSHDEFLSVKQQILGITKIPSIEIEENYEKFFDLIQNAINGDSNSRNDFREKLGTGNIKPITWLLQLLRETNNQKFEKMYKSQVKSVIQKNFHSKYPFVDSLYKQLRSCLGESEKLSILHTVIQPSQMSEMNSKLKAIKSEDDFQEYRNRKEALKKIFNPEE